MSNRNASRTRYNRKRKNQGRLKWKEGLKDQDWGAALCLFKMAWQQGDIVMSQQHQTCQFDMHCRVALQQRPKLLNLLPVSRKPHRSWCNTAWKHTGVQRRTTLVLLGSWVNLRQIGRVMEDLFDICKRQQVPTTEAIHTTPLSSQKAFRISRRIWRDWGTLSIPSNTSGCHHEWSGKV